MSMNVKEFGAALDRQQLTALAAALGGKTVYYLRHKLTTCPENFSISEAKAIMEYAESIGVHLKFEGFFS